jgi:hypothetical protein
MYKVSFPPARGGTSPELYYIETGLGFLTGYPAWLRTLKRDNLSHLYPSKWGDGLQKHD